MLCFEVKTVNKTSDLEVYSVSSLVPYSLQPADQSWVEPTYAAYEPFLNVDSVAHQERGTAGDSVRVKTYARPNERSWGRKNPAHIAGSVTFTTVNLNIH